VIAEARLETEHASRYLVELCRRLGEKGGANPDHGVRVRWTDTQGTLDFGWARCRLSVLPGALEVRAEADDGEALAQIRELVSRHLEQHAGNITITWREDGVPIARTPPEGRDAMRGFHRRMRRESP
jgi:uncharacterized protein